MSTSTRLIEGVKIPKFVRVRQYFPHNEMNREQIIACIAENFARPEIKATIRPGMSICITAGSRGVANIETVTRAIVDNVKALGADPFIIPAMGSHGGATAEGQREILTSYNITEETMGCPIRATMETVKIGFAEEIGEEVQIDRYAKEADGIIVVNRIKAHTGFKGHLESGLMKMMTIGLGKQAGAYVAHKAGDDNMPPRLDAIGREIIRKANILFGVGLMENAHEGTFKIPFLLPDEIPEQEPILLNEAKDAMAKIFLDACDVIILEQIGKNFSGGGMDPNVVGRSRLPIGIKSERMGIFGLSEESHGNATGMGRADVATMRFFKTMTFDGTYPNAITDHDSSVYKIPLIMDNDKECLQCSMAICLNMDAEKPRIIILKNSLDVETMLISEALIPEAMTRKQLTILDKEPFELEFDSEGNFLTKY